MIPYTDEEWQHLTYGTKSKWKKYKGIIFMCFVPTVTLVTCLFLLIK